MRIAQVAPLAEAVPPKLYGGTERVVSWLTEELVRQGHDVTLFATGDSETSAKLVAACPKGLRLAGYRDHLASHLVMLRNVLRRADDFDVIHFHVDLLQHALFESIASRTITTMHGRLDIPDFMPVYSAFQQMPLVSISLDQRKPMPSGTNWIANIPHGLPASVCPFNATGGDYLVFLGRISPEKRPDRAIEIAKRAGIRLKMAAKVDGADQAYFDSIIAPLLNDPLIEFIGEVDEQQKSVLLGGARALLFPIDWPEPFGLVVIEAMSAGTPVVAWSNGSVPEVIADGVSGFIVDTIDGAVKAVADTATLSREGVRSHFEENFSVAAMAGRYVQAYSRLLDGHALAPEKRLPPSLSLPPQFGSTSSIKLDGHAGAHIHAGA